MLYALLFENLWLLSILVLLAVLVALVVHRRHAAPSTRKGLRIVLSAGVALVLTNWLVVTDAEKIIAAVQRMAQAVDQGNIPALAAEIAPRFEDRGLDKEQFVARINQELQRTRVDEPRLSAWKTEIGPDAATVSFRCFCDIRQGGEFQSNALTRWKMEFARDGQSWKLIGIPVAKYGPLDGIDLHQLGW